MLNSARLRVARAAVVTAGAALALGFSLPAGAARTDARAANPQGAAASAPRTATADPDREICVIAQITGSRLNRRICRTQREWDADGGVPTER